MKETRSRRDEGQETGVDAELRRAFEPSEEAVRRVVTGALADRSKAGRGARGPRPWTGWLEASRGLAPAALALAMALAIFAGHQVARLGSARRAPQAASVPAPRNAPASPAAVVAAASPAVLSLTNRGGVVTVESSAGAALVVLPEEGR